MKKAYQKPDIAFESFSLTTSVAAGCELRPTGSTTSCGAEWGKDMLFNARVGDACLSKPENGADDFDFACYHNPVVDFNLFFS